MCLCSFYFGEPFCSEQDCCGLRMADDDDMADFQLEPKRKKVPLKVA